jgi:hypothetical protein
MSPRNDGVQADALDEDDQELSGVEAEPEELGLVIDRPFDPEKIKVKTKAALVDSIVSRISHKEIDLAPDFQRHANIWNPVRKARLIESLLLRIPLPVFYVAADADENWAVVDGLQRITTIDDFVNNRFALSNLEYLTQLNSLTFGKLPRPMQRRIRETELVVHVIDPGTPEEVMFNIFSRINTGGMRLNGQEIRHALHKGPARDYLKRLSLTNEFLDATERSVRPDRMADRECALRFLAFRITPWEEYKANDLDGFLSEAMNKLNQMPQPLVRRPTISRRNTPDLVHGSRNLTFLSTQMFAPPLSAAHSSASVSSIRLASSGGVNTSSFERFAMHVSTSGLRPRNVKPACVLMRPPSVCLRTRR